MHWLIYLLWWQQPIPIPDPTIPPAPPTVVAEPEIPVAAIDVADSAGVAVVDQIGVGQMIVVSSAKATHAKVPGSLVWILEPAVQSYVSPDGATVIVNTGLTPGQLSITQIVGATSGRVAYQKMLLRIGAGPQPPPVDPVDPKPDPDPKPPAPDPTPQPGKLKILIVEETADRGKLPSSQMEVLFSPAIRAYVKTACSKSSDGNPDFRVYDVDTDTAKEAGWVQVAMKEPRASLPWVVLSNGVTGFSGPLPKTEAETLELLKKYGGR